MNGQPRTASVDFDATYQCRIRTLRRPRYHTGVRSTALAVALSLFAGVTLFAHDLTNHSPSTAVVVFSCPMHPEVTLTQAGACSRCGMKLQSRNTKANEIPHADHNPKHGGSFTMVDDYHMELVEAEEEFRLYLYDALTQPPRKPFRSSAVRSAETGGERSAVSGGGVASACRSGCRRGRVRRLEAGRPAPGAGPRQRDPRCSTHASGSARNRAELPVVGHNARGSVARCLATAGRGGPHADHDDDFRSARHVGMRSANSRARTKIATPSGKNGIRGCRVSSCSFTPSPLRSRVLAVVHRRPEFPLPGHMTVGEQHAAAVGLVCPLVVRVRSRAESRPIESALTLSHHRRGKLPRVSANECK